MRCKVLVSRWPCVIQNEIYECLTHVQSDTENSPDEFAGICGIIYKIEQVNKASALEVVQFVRKKRTRKYATSAFVQTRRVFQPHYFIG